jgi:hypothetical protein
MAKLVAILSGEDWADAGVEYVVINNNVDLDECPKVKNKNTLVFRLIL